MERGMMFAYRAIVEHEVLQRVLVTEPEMLLPMPTEETNRTREGIAFVLTPYLDDGMAAGADLRTPPTSWPGWSCRTSGHLAAGTWRTRTRWPGWSVPSCWPEWWYRHHPG